jgi:hypothetical protein
MIQTRITPAARNVETNRIEAPCSKLQGIFDRKEFCLFLGSLANPAASGGECARFAVQTPDPASSPNTQ